MREIDRLVIHHSASPREVSTETIRGWHMDPNKQGGPYSDIGYHWVIEGDGSLHTGRPVIVSGAHVKGHNAHSLGICVTGDNTVSGMGWCDAQWDTLVGLIQSVRVVFPDLPVCGHRDLADTTECPGLDVIPALQAVGIENLP